jgi:phage regulator Rha-like protein
MNIEFKDGWRVCSKEVAKFIGVSHSQLKKTIEKYHNHFEDFGYLYRAGDDYYLSLSHCEIAILCSHSEIVRARLLFTNLYKDFMKGRQF